MPNQDKTTEKTKRVLIIGSKGRMGRVTVEAVKEAPDLELVSTCDSNDHLATVIKSSQPDIAIDFSLPHCVFEHATQLIQQDVHPVIGATGLSDEQLEQLNHLCDERKLGGIYAPNFSLGAVLLIQFAKQAAEYLPHSEIIEMHHAQKVDKPSGTAIHTQKAMGRDTPIHSVRLPGLFAHETVLFGGEGETLTLRHDAIDRRCMMPGVLLACRRVTSTNAFVIGLEHYLQ